MQFLQPCVTYAWFNYPPAGIGQSDFCKEVDGVSLDSPTRPPPLCWDIKSYGKDLTSYRASIWLRTWNSIHGLNYLDMYIGQCTVYKDCYYKPSSAALSFLYKNVHRFAGLDSKHTQVENFFVIIELTVIWEKFAVNYFHEAGEPREWNAWIYVYNSNFALLILLGCHNLGKILT